ncbi:hypothetical protein CONLIGDRAFT_650207 [Coniochaeta ligniaria NRRL 30616]|uniref:F-box domain-containing protein n=1 Tax=Coniochaeta ligniaria NRRL 30616 TaxID=1408157 RepID=A0A1J7J0T2_9PEZI|nr:hypothetical protein CONLIGDRAFT_650207 [Coniochaeta ligniaria NRRL 30616]
MPVQTRAGAAREAYARANRQGHLPVEVWLIIVSFIPYHDRPEAWFLLRSLSKASKQAVEDIYMRFYLPHLKAFSVFRNSWTCTAYRYDGLTDQGSTRFVTFACGLERTEYHSLLGFRPRTNIGGLRDISIDEVMDIYRPCVNIPYDGRQLICDLPFSHKLWKRQPTPGAEWGTCSRLPWRNVLSTLLREKRAPNSDDGAYIITFHLEHDESERAWQQAVTRPIPPVHRTEPNVQDTVDPGSLSDLEI